MKLKAWLKPLVRQLKNDSAVKVVRQLEEVLATLPAGAPRAAVQTKVNYFHEHQARMDYPAARRRGEPLGSDAVEATCRQYQCRFKRPCQFWSRFGDESAPVPGNTLAQRPLASPLPSRSTFRSHKKLRCAPGEPRIYILLLS